MSRKPNKFWNRASVRSGLEQRVREDLDRRGIVYGYESIKLQYVKQECPHCGEAVKTGRYTPDFVLMGKTGNVIVVEAKGRFTTEDRRKLKAVKQGNPKVDLRILFQVNTPIRKGAKRRNGDWSDLYGFKWAVGESIPNEWLEELK